MLFSYEEGEELLRMRNVAALKRWNEERRRHTPPEALALTDEQINDLVQQARR